jgi:hypothetical protein
MASYKEENLVEINKPPFVHALLSSLGAYYLT